MTLSIAGGRESNNSFLLNGIETQSPIVVVQQLKVRRSALQKEKLDRVELVVATYARAQAAKKPAAAAPAEGEATP